MGHAQHDRERPQSRICCSSGKYGHQLHFWDLRKRRHVQSIDLGAEQQMVLELRPSHDPAKPTASSGSWYRSRTYRGSIWLWHRDNGDWQLQKVIEIPAEPADPAQLPELLKGFRRCRHCSAISICRSTIAILYASCWGTGEMRQYDVSDPFHPKLVGSVHIGGIARRTPHPLSRRPLSGGPQMVEISRDGARLLYQLALSSLGRSVLSGRNRKLDGKA